MPFINDLLNENSQINTSKPIPSITRFNFDDKLISQKLHSEIIGQDKALAKISNVLKVVKTGISNPDKPLAVILLVGPTGVGKTQTIRVISQAIYGSMDNFCRIDMNTLAQEHYSASLTGAPPGYVGSKEGNTLFDIPLIEGSYSKPGIVLFDEVEKASKEVLRSLLNVMDNGNMTLTSGVKSINFKNSIIFMTSNLGARELSNFQQSFIYSFYNKFSLDVSSKENKILQKALKNCFDPEFINRIDAILYYEEIKTSYIKQIIQLEINKLNQRLETYKLKVVLSSNAFQNMAEKYDKKYGARDIGRKFRMYIEPIVADFILNGRNEKSEILIDELKID